MILEAYTLVYLALISAVAWRYGELMTASVAGWPILAPFAWLLLLASLGYGLLLLPVWLIVRLTLPGLFTGGTSGDEVSGSGLGGWLHGVAGVALVGAALLLVEPAAPLAVVGLSGCLLLAGWLWRWRVRIRPITNPARPTATLKKSHIAVSWNPPLDDRIYTYRLVRTVGSEVPYSPRQGKLLLWGAQECFKDEELEPGKRYSYTLFGLDARGRFGAATSNAVTSHLAGLAPVLAEPEASLYEITLRWQFNQSDLDELARFELTERTFSQGVLLRTQTHPVRKALQHTLSGFTPGTVVEYQVVAVFANGERAASAPVTTATLVRAPHIAIEVDPRQRNQVRLDWSGDRVLRPFQAVTVSRQGSGEKMPTTLTSGMIDYWIDTSCDYDTAYIYRVQAHYEGPVKSEVAERPVQTLPRPQAPAADSFQLVPATDSISLSWSSPPWAREVRLSRVWDDPIDGPAAWTRPLAISAAAYKDEQGLKPDVSYTYKLEFLDEHGNLALPLIKSGALRPLPRPVSSLTAVWRDDSGSVDLSWQFTEPNSGLRALIVRGEGRAPASPADGELIYGASGSSCADPSVQPGRTYIYVCFTEDAVGARSIGVRCEVRTKAELSLRVAVRQPGGKDLVTSAHDHTPELVLRDLVDGILVELVARSRLILSQAPDYDITRYKATPRQPLDPSLTLRQLGLANGDVLVVSLRPAPQPGPGTGSPPVPGAPGDPVTANAGGSAP